MASLPSSELRFLTQAGEPAGDLKEWSPAYVEVVGATADELDQDLEVRRQGQALTLAARKLAGEVRVVADWPFVDPGFHNVELVRNGAVVERSRVQVAPVKISSHEFGALLNDLQSRLPASVALSLKRMGALTGVHLRPLSQSTVAEELRRLQVSVEGVRSVDRRLRRPGLAQFLPELQKEPHRMLIKDEVWVQRELARRPDPANVVRALWRPHNLGPELRPVILVDTRVEHSVDVYENRLVKAYVHEVRIRLRRLSRLSSGGVAEESKDLLRTLDRAERQADFLEDVSLLAVAPSRLTMVQLRRPPYRAALEGYIELHRSLAATLEDGALDAPLDNVPHLYELWGTLTVIQVVLAVAAELDYEATESRMTRRIPGFLYVRVLPDGKPVVVLTHRKSGRRVRLIPQRSFGSAASGLHSITYSQRPDLTVEVTDRDGAVRLYIFDPKYKLDSESLTAASDEAQDLLESEPDGDEGVLAAAPPLGSPKKVDIDKMHTYRDAIRGSLDRSVVRYAATLYPGADTPLHPSLEALCARPDHVDSLESALRSKFVDWLADGADEPQLTEIEPPGSDP